MMRRVVRDYGMCDDVNVMVMRGGGGKFLWEDVKEVKGEIEDKGRRVRGRG